MDSRCDDDIIDAANILWDLYYQKKTCQLCKSTETVQWRKCQIYKTLCNKCGVRLYRKNK